jgi:hypothetical protein
VGTLHDQRIGQMDESPRPGEKDAGCDRREDPIWQHLSTGMMLQMPNFRRWPVFHTENQKRHARIW